MPVLPETLLDEAARRFALLSDPTRLRVLSGLHDAGEISVGALAEQTGLPIATVSQHLNRLLLGGLVSRRRAGRSALYRVSDPTVEAICDLVCAGLQGNARKVAS